MGPEQQNLLLAKRHPWECAALLGVLYWEVSHWLVGTVWFQVHWELIMLLPSSAGFSTHSPWVWRTQAEPPKAIRTSSQQSWLFPETLRHELWPHHKSKQWTHDPIKLLMVSYYFPLGTHSTLCLDHWKSVSVSEQQFPSATHPAFKSCVASD